MQNPTPISLHYTVVIDLLTGSQSIVDQVEARPGAVVGAGASAPWTAEATAEPAGVTGCRVTAVIRTPG